MPRRVEDRVRAQMPAEIVRFSVARDCVIRDISPRGARLQVDDVRKVPDQFELVIRQTGEARPAHVRWRRGSEVGVSFLPERRAFGRRSAPPALEAAAAAPNRPVSRG